MSRPGPFNHHPLICLVICKFFTTRPTGWSHEQIFYVETLSLQKQLINNDTTFCITSTLLICVNNQLLCILYLLVIGIIKSCALEESIINPRCACAARVVLSVVCVCVCVCVCVSTLILALQATMRSISDTSDFRTTPAWKIKGRYSWNVESDKLARSRTALRGP